MEMLRLHVGRDHGRGEIISLLRAVDDSLSRKEEVPWRVFQPPGRRDREGFAPRTAL